MKECSRCGGGHVRAVRRTKRRYEFRGLRDIILHDIPLESCLECGHAEIVGGDVDALRHAVAGAIVAKRERLMPSEIRFLLKELGLSAVSLATHLGATPESVARWENGRTPMGVTADRLLRLMVIFAQDAAYPLKPLRTVAREDANTIPIHLRRIDGRWHASIGGQSRESSVRLARRDHDGASARRAH